MIDRAMVIHVLYNTLISSHLQAVLQLIKYITICNTKVETQCTTCFNKPKPERKVHTKANFHISHVSNQLMFNLGTMIRQDRVCKIIKPITLAQL